MQRILIADTTRKERERIVAESIGNIDGACDGCSPGFVEMYQNYIEGREELREINMEFRAGYISHAPALLREAEAPAAPGWHPQDAPGLVAPAFGSGATAIGAIGPDRSGCDFSER